MPFWGHGEGQGQPQPLSCHGLGDFFLKAGSRPLDLPRSPRSWPRCRTTAGEMRGRAWRGEEKSSHRRGGLRLAVARIAQHPPECSLAEHAHPGTLPRAPLSGHHHLCRYLGSLTLSQWDGDDNSIAGAHPEAVASNEQGSDAHEGEAQLARAWRERGGGVSAVCWALSASPGSAQHSLTQHLADIGLDVHILQVLVRVGMVQSQRRVQADGHPHTVANPRQLPHLALPPWVGVK